MKNRVNYLEKEEKRMQQKMSVIQKRVDVRENAIRAKQQDRLRQALRLKRDEAIAEKKKNDVKQMQLKRQLEKNEKQEQLLKQREEMHKNNMYEKMVKQVEKEMSEETNLILNFNRAEKIKNQKQKMQEDRMILKQAQNFKREDLIEETVEDMQEYVRTRQEQIDALERKERELLDRIKQTQANQNALIQRHV